MPALTDRAQATELSVLKEPAHFNAAVLEVALRSRRGTDGVWSRRDGWRGLRTNNRGTVEPFDESWRREHSVLRPPRCLLGSMLHRALSLPSYSRP